MCSTTVNVHRDSDSPSSLTVSGPGPVASCLTDLTSVATLFRVPELSSIHVKGRPDRVVDALLSIGTQATKPDRRFPGMPCAHHVSPTKEFRMRRDNVVSTYAVWNSAAFSRPAQGSVPDRPGNTTANETGGL